MKTFTIIGKVVRSRRRAIELYDFRNSPFTPKKVESKVVYKRVIKHKLRDLEA
jgi:hypothetical protein